MITKTIIKDFVNKKCPYLVSLELSDKNLVELFKKYIDLTDKYKELIQDDKEEGDEGEELFDLNEALKDHPEIRKEIKRYQRNQPKNAVDL